MNGVNADLFGLLELVANVDIGIATVANLKQFWQNARLIISYYDFATKCIVSSLNKTMVHEHIYTVHREHRKGHTDNKPDTIVDEPARSRARG